MADGHNEQLRSSNVPIEFGILPTQFSVTVWKIVLTAIFLSGAAAPAEAQKSAEKMTGTETRTFGGKQNHLARETSPYLRMHASNPVDWYPWGPEALQKAVAENKPIFLSIGYSTCYWCHVMERLVFENREIAAYMNEHFVNIKVDREERPDIDEVYMRALQVYFQLAQSSQGGGWPLSVFLTPDGKPIAGGTYFPPDEQPGQTSFPTVLRQIWKAWTTREKDVRSTAELITREVARLSVPPVVTSPVKLGPELVARAVHSIEAAYDPDAGGLDFDPKAPEGAKFPAPCRLQLLQSQVGLSPEHGNVDPAHMLDHTLTAMSEGGLWDHLGGGFHRYSTDRRWRVPHFEKMLYDNAQLAEIYVEAYRRTGRERYRHVAEEIFTFIARELTGPQGEFYSALDAETDGDEGAYYLWTRDELEDQLTAGNFRIFSAAYGIDQPATIGTRYVLQLPRPLSETAELLGMSLSELETRLSEMRVQLLAVRQKRAPLRKDDKILTGWNGLMIRAYARGGQILKRQDYLEAASRAAVLILAEHRDPSGGLLRIDGEKEVQQPAFLEDYACLISGLLALHEATHEDKWLNAARRLSDDQLRAFWDQRQGGFLFASNRQETVLAPLKNAFDNEIPSGNSLSAQNLVRLSRAKSDETYRKYAEKTLATFGPQWQESPERSPYLALALQEYLHWYGSPQTQAAGDGLFSGSLSQPRSPDLQPMRPIDVPGKTPAPPTFATPPGTVTVQLAPEPGTIPEAPHFQVRGFLDVDSVSPGMECRMAVEFAIEQGWHLNANPAQPEFVIPLTVKLQSPAEARLEEIHYPPGEMLKISGIDQPLAVYQGRTLVTGKLIIPQTQLRTLPLKIAVRVQLCNEKNCLAPTTVVLSGHIPISPAGTQPEQINTAIFDPSSPPSAAPGSPRKFPE